MKRYSIFLALFFYSFSLFIAFTCTIKPAYNGQPRQLQKVAFVDRWPLFRATETPGFSRYQLRLAFVNRKPLLTGTLMHRFDCTYHFLCSWNTGSWHCRLLIYWLTFIIGANWCKTAYCICIKINNNSFYRAIHLLLTNFILYTIYSFKE